ncbi:MAG: AmmeMemoRadiSam system protein B [Gammaproteobacteria bacterium]|nr:AmmeMemoRadiSam system protein B [Gammaproteobacteria bacterium]
MKVIMPNVAGTFYPAKVETLRETVFAMLEDAAPHKELPIPKALIAPHAGYIYSGPIAASAFACLTRAKNTLKNVVVLAPAHLSYVSGIAMTKAEYYETPLGRIPINHDLLKKVSALPQLIHNEKAFMGEHAIEVELPFLQLTLENFSLVPLLVGNITPKLVAEVIEKLWGDEETLIVISSDLSHYQAYNVAKALDKQTAAAILALDFAAVMPDSACGSIPICGLLEVAKQKHLTASLIDLRNSGDTAGPRDHVVGYGAFHFR